MLSLSEKNICDKYFRFTEEMISLETAKLKNMLTRDHRKLDYDIKRLFGGSAYIHIINCTIVITNCEYRERLVNLIVTCERNFIQTDKARQLGNVLTALFTNKRSLYW